MREQSSRTSKTPRIQVTVRVLEKYSDTRLKKKRRVEDLTKYTWVQKDKFSKPTFYFTTELKLNLFDK